MHQYSWVDAVVTLVLVLAASIAGAILKTGLFHFVVALSILPRVDYEAMALNLSPLFYAYATTAAQQPLDGIMVFHDSWGASIVTVALGLVEFVSEYMDENHHPEIRKKLLVFFIINAAVWVAFCIGIPLLLWCVTYSKTQGSTYCEVVRRDGGLSCLLSGERGTGFRCADQYPTNVGVGPLQAQQASLAGYWNGIGRCTTPSKAHCDQWVLCGPQRWKLTEAQKNLFVGHYLDKHGNKL